MTGTNRNVVWAGVLMDELARAGVRHVVLAPGSRSTPLVMAAADHPELRVFRFLDERSAAFFALGIGKALGRPAAVVTTSGTAAANLFPAVVEAAAAETPLLVLTADRPHRLRGADANQTIDQNRLFGPYVREFVETAPPVVDASSLEHLRVLADRMVASALGLPAGPVHLNVPFAKPLEPVHVPGDVPTGFSDEHQLAALGRDGGGPFTRIAVRRPAVAPREVDRLASRVRATPRGLVVAGPSPDPGRDGSAALALATATGFPLLADPLSGARFGPSGGASRIGGYDLFLRDELVHEPLRPDLVLRVGRAPTSSALCDHLDRAKGAEHWVVDPGDRWKDYLGAATEYVRACVPELASALSWALERDAAGRVDPEGAGAPAPVGAAPSTDEREAEREAWRNAWTGAGQAAEEIAGERFGGELFEGAAIAEVMRLLPPSTTVFVSSSMPVRDVDAFAFPREAHLLVYGNRGASGIDGILSSAAGVAAAGGSQVVALVGDIAFAHDMNGLLAARDHSEVLFVVVNNDGGGIFHMLPVREYEPAFTEYFATPHGLDFSHAARTYGLPHERVADIRGLAEAVQRGLAEGGSRIIEITTDREENRLRREAAVDAVRTTSSGKPSPPGEPE